MIQGGVTMTTSEDESIKKKSPEELLHSEEQKAVETLSKSKPEEIAALLKKWLADE